MSQTQGLIDFDAFMAETGIDEDTIKELYQVFLEEILQEKARLTVRFAEKDYEKLGRTIHNVKGIAASYKAHCVLEPATAINIDLKEGRHDGLDRKLADLTAAIESAASNIRMHFSIE